MSLTLSLYHTKSPNNLNQGDCRSQLHYLRLNKHINYTNKHYAIHGNIKFQPHIHKARILITAQSSLSPASRKMRKASHT